KPQINLLYMFTLGGDIGYPVYYKQYLGSTLDVSAFSDMLKESTVYADNCTVIADKGFASDDDFSLLEECGLNYVIPLKRGNR
ncbi:transposase, partial [Staphylococcus aureus]|uniref:transposase n=2 Tax=Bacteria TaxID=2 RepID=UPI001CF3B5F3